MPEPPDQAAIHQNAMFDFALKSAPNVLYAKFKQYGQVSDRAIIGALNQSFKLCCIVSWVFSDGAPSSAR